MAGSSLGELAGAVGGEVDPAEGAGVRVEDVIHDSRQAGPGRLFVAVVGATADGHDHLGEAVAAGSPAVCVSRRVEVTVPRIVVGDTRRAMGMLAATAHGHPSHELDVIGVTGTNGKTTVTHYVEAIAIDAGHAAGLIGTVGARAAGEPMPLERTTPEATDFQRLLAVMRDQGCRLVAVEVSSHALALDRVRATRFAVAAFTNLSQDHLDFHGDMSSYLAAKETLFHEYEVGTAVINVDDPAGLEIASRSATGVIRVGEGADAFAADVELGRSHSSFRLVTPWGERRVTIGATGRFNVDNAVIASVCCLAAGLGIEDVAAALDRLPVVPGRFQTVSGDDPVMVIVDYAHTPDGISQSIRAARSLGDGRVIALAGAGGDRDREKRPLMGRALAPADVVFVTSDNPRSEDPKAIVDAVRAGIPPGPEVRVEVDRATAIRLAIAEGAPGDVVLLLGRGHEPFQEVAGERLDFDDRIVAARALAELRSSANSGRETGSMAP